MSFDSESEYEICNCNVYTRPLPFKPSSLEKIILTIGDKFDFRIVMSNKKIAAAALMTTGLAIVGGLIGKHYGGKVGAAVGGAVGGACGIGIIAVSMREIWTDIKPKLTELYDIVYDYLTGLGVEDYKIAFQYIVSGNVNSVQLAMLLVQAASEILGKKVLSNLTAA